MRARILGFDAVAGGTIANVSLSGQIGIAGTRLVSDNMLLRSDRVERRGSRSPSISPAAAISPRCRAG